jgi:hypothetical protein
MAGVSRITELEARKRALVAESERSREALKADLANVQHYTSGFFTIMDRARSFSPWLLMAIPAAIPLLKLFRGGKAEKPRSPLKGRLAKLMLGVRIFRQYGPMVRSLIGRFQARRSAAAAARTSTRQF